MNDDLIVTTTPGIAEIEAILLAVLWGLVIFLVTSYVITAVLSMILLKRAGHRRPWAAWVPVWNEVILLQLAGIRRPWVITLVLIGFSGVSTTGLIGWALDIAILALWVFITVWIVKGVHAGFGIGKLVLGSIVAVVCLPAWLIWMIVLSYRHEYDVFEAVSTGAEFPLTKQFPDTTPQAYAAFADR